MKLNRRTIVPASLVLALTALCWGIGEYAYQRHRHHRTPVDPANGFLVKPYLQLGDAPNSGSAETVEVLWHTLDDRAEAEAPPWRIEVRGTGDTDWRPSDEPTRRRAAVPGTTPHLIHRARLSGLKPGAAFDYRLTRDGRTRFEAAGKARPAPGTPSRAVVFGDFGSGSAAEARIADRVWATRPDVVVLAGDLVYHRGRIFEYARRFFPYLNADRADPASGAPLLRSTLVLPVPGNHDLLSRDLSDHPDAQAYFYYWSAPLNGPVAREDAPGSPEVKGTAEEMAAFREAAGPAYPRMANYSVDVGDVHWTVIDLNLYVDWSDPGLRGWLERDLASAKDKPWRFVVGHQPGFQSGRAHRHEKQMRQLAPIFERGGVSIVFAGHVHNYQRSRPLTFVPKRRPNGKFADGYGRVEGNLAVDYEFDGAARAAPRGVIYLVTGAGAPLHDTERADQAENANDFTVKFVADRHSVTLVDVTPEELRVRQVADMGDLLDEFRVRREYGRVADRRAP